MRPTLDDERLWTTRQQVSNGCIHIAAHVGCGDLGVSDLHLAGFGKHGSIHFIFRAQDDISLPKRRAHVRTESTRVMLLTGAGIRETILFPLVKPEQHDTQ